MFCGIPSKDELSQIINNLWEKPHPTNNTDYAMKTIIEDLKEQIPHGKHCNPDTSLWPNLDNNCPYHQVGIYCSLHEENVGNNKICEINEVNVGLIVREYLDKHGYDGLCCEDCGCLIDDDFIPCEGEITDCEPGYKKPCPGESDCEEGCHFHVCINK